MAGAIDIFIKAKVEAGELKACCLSPFITSIRLNRLGPGDTADRNGDARSSWAMNLMRHSYCVECDHAAAAAVAKQQLTVAQADAHHQLLQHMFGLIITHAFRAG